jgi:hypothetical protein
MQCGQIHKFLNNGSSTLAPRRRWFAVIKANKGFGGSDASKNAEQIKVLYLNLG